MKVVIVILRVLLGIISLGVSERYFWIHRQIKARGGRHAGRLGLSYARHEGDRLIVSSLVRKTRVPLSQVAAVDHSWATASAVVSTTGRRRVRVAFPLTRLFGDPSLVEYLAA